MRINSGKFIVEWQRTKTVLEAGELDVAVVRPAAEMEKEKEEEELERRMVGVDGRKPLEAGDEKGGHEQESGAEKRKREVEVIDEGEKWDCEKAVGRSIHTGFAKSGRRRKSWGWTII